MNIQSEEDCLIAWEQEAGRAQTDHVIPLEDRERVAHETDQEFSGIYDAVTAYVNSRFMRVC